MFVTGNGYHWFGYSDQSSMATKYLEYSMNQYITASRHLIGGYVNAEIVSVLDCCGATMGKKRRATRNKRQRTSNNAEEDSDVEYEVERICAKRKRQNTIEYSVKWKNYPDPSWEVIENLNCPDLIKAFEDSQKPKAARSNRTTTARQSIQDVQQAKQALIDVQQVKQASDALDASSIFTPPASNDFVFCSGCGLRKDGRHGTCACNATEGLSDKETQVEPTVETNNNENRTSDARHEPDGDYVYDNESNSDEEMKDEEMKEAVPAPVKTTPTNHSPILLSGRKKGLERIYIGKLVAYAPSSYSFLHTKYNKKHYASAGTALIVGRVCDYRYVNKVGRYEIRWLDSIYHARTEQVELKVIKEGRHNFDLLHAKPTTQWANLCRADAQSAIEIDDAENLSECEDYQEFQHKEVNAISLAEIERTKSIRFEPGGTLRAPRDLYTHEDGMQETRIKPEHQHLFEHSATSSLFAYLPISFWKQVLLHTNQQAREKNIIGTKTQLFTLDELMKFLGIMWFMAAVDKGEYANYWGEQIEDAIFETTTSNLDNIMSLRRFKLLRAAFCFRSSSDISAIELKRDSAVRIRPVLNMLKEKGSCYVEVGRNLAVDEASVSARHKFARHMIVYNSSKPTGKYHFRFYMVCCSTSWLCLSFRLHCESSMQVRASGLYDQTETQALVDEMEPIKKTRQIVLEITRPFHGSNRIINCDNYYTSVQLLLALKLKGLYCRGTIKRVSKHFPRHVILCDPNITDKNANKSARKRQNDKDEDEEPDNADDEEEPSGLEDDSAIESQPSTNTSGEVKRGDFLYATSEELKIAAASWCDGNIVTIVSNADTSVIDSVTRLVNKKKIQVPAPVCIKEYNKHMQGVDRNDQIRARFSVADGHSFKKWYKKLGFAIVDIARVNAFLTRRLCMSDKLSERDAHRNFMIELIREMLNGKWQDAPSDDVMLFDADLALFQPSPLSTPRAAQSPSMNTGQCADVDSLQVFPEPSKRRQRMCIVCRFEGRKETVNTMHCVNHVVSLCKRVHTASNSFGCQQQEWTCWDKYHRYYLPGKVFSESGTIARASKDYQDKKQQAARALSFALAATTPTPATLTTPMTPVTPALSHISSAPSYDFAP